MSMRSQTQLLCVADHIKSVSSLVEFWSVCNMTETMEYRSVWRKFSSCPLKKRPVSIAFEKDDDLPQDLSTKQRRHNNDREVPRRIPQPSEQAHSPPIYSHLPHTSFHLPHTFLTCPHDASTLCLSQDHPNNYLEPSLANYYRTLFQSNAVHQHQYAPLNDLWSQEQAMSPSMQPRIHQHPAFSATSYQLPFYRPTHHMMTGMFPSLSPLSCENRLVSPSSTMSEDSGIGAEVSNDEEEIDVIGDVSPTQSSLEALGNSDLSAGATREDKSKGASLENSSCGQSRSRKPFSCKQCDKVYSSLGALKMHIRTHTLPCKCPVCGKSFSRPWLLQGHIRTHTGEKPFHCPQCERCFADRSNLRAHLQTHTNVKKYACSACAKTFSRMSLLNKHVRVCCPKQRHNPQQDKESTCHGEQFK